jgi:N-acetylglucosaminyldiphosphoundecaprenol N-acetyl-beta-D-mannosaminyltransferase
VSATQQILGVRFFNGTAAEAVAELQRSGGYVVVPAAPALVKLRSDPFYRTALTKADLAIADSSLMVMSWRWLHRRRIIRVSGLAYLKALLRLPAMHEKTFWILPNEAAAARTRSWLRDAGFAAEPEDFYVAPFYGNEVRDDALAASLDSRRPANIVIGIGGGPQEKLGLFLRDHLRYRPAIHCIGAAIGFLTGDQVAIPDWADRFYLGWLFRLISQPRVFAPRFWSACALPGLIARYGEQLPPLKAKR